jgi:5S rRNA maturation endonuclease (ribonuclease M5)
MFDITLNDIITLYGQPKDKAGSNYRQQCPYCIDSSKNNMLFDPDYVRNTGYKGIVKCYVSDEHCSSIMRDITKYKKDQGFRPDIKINHIPPKKKEIRINTHYHKYQYLTNKKLLQNKEAMEYIKNKWGLTKETIEFTGIGINTRKRTWVLPICNTQGYLVGFETRDVGLKCGKEKRVRKITMKDGSCNCFAQINSEKGKEILIILEGFKDAYTFWQYLHEQDQDQYYHIITPSTGVGTVLRLLRSFNLNQYKKVILFLDSDTESITIMKEAKKQYPFIDLKILNCGCKDFNEHYQKCIKKES